MGRACVSISRVVVATVLSADRIRISEVLWTVQVSQMGFVP